MAKGGNLSKSKEKENGEEVVMLEWGEFKRAIA